MPDTQHLLEIENLDPKYESAREFLKIKRNALCGFNLSYTVKVISRETTLIDGSTPNPGIAIDPLFYKDIRASDF
ncbi:hypothetical protein B0J14DRAFT_703873 [Halenospora varia]|nr:hypothetical protein B0J14DRAFT_703873 [Halenospora varia]